MRLGSVSGGGKVACHVGRDFVDCCVLVGCENRFVCVEIGVSTSGECIVRVGRGCMRYFVGWIGSKGWSEMVGSY